MSVLADLPLFAAPQPHRPVNRRRALSRVLAKAEPLSEPREKQAWAEWWMAEHKAALSSEGRARHEATQATKRNAPTDEQRQLHAIMEREQTRLLRLRDALLRRIT